MISPIYQQQFSDEFMSRSSEAEALGLWMLKFTLNEGFFQEDLHSPPVDDSFLTQSVLYIGKPYCKVVY